MVNYQQGKIYKIVANDLIYIGSTCEPTLARRMANHRYDYNYWKNGKKKGYISSFKVLENSNAEIILLESFPCNSKDELHAREKFYIEKNECVNKNIPTRTKKEWYEDNNDKINEKSKKYYEDNKDKKKEYHEKYREENKDKLKAFFKKCYEDNKEKRGEKIKCECGRYYRFDGKSCHLKTNIHKKIIQKQI